MARLIGLPEWSKLIAEINSRDSLGGERIGQFVWNKYGQRGIDGAGWPEFFYADDAKAIDMLEKYMGYGRGDSYHAS